jgi:glucokinase
MDGIDTLAVDIGGTKSSIAGFADGRLILRDTRPTDRSQGPIGILAYVAEVVTRWKREEGFEAARCGIGFGGPVDYPSQAVVTSTHVAGWTGFPLIAEVEKRVGAPAVMDNDANVGALGEAFFGAGAGCDSLFYMTLSTGIGGGIIVGGQVLRGADSFGGEIGHMNIVPDGPDCLCSSNGCLERMCCGLWLERDYGQTAQTLLQDPGFVSRYVEYLARGLKAALMILNPSRIIIGGGISKAGDRLFLPLRQELDRQMPAWSRARREVVPAALADDSVLYGALALAAQHFGPRSTTGGTS